MSSATRSNSGVRNLRAMFENNKSDIALDKSPDRGRSPAARIGGSGSNSIMSDNNQSPAGARKVTSSFVAVSPVGKPLDKTESGSISRSLRRQSFSLSEEQDMQVINTLKKTVTEEFEKRQAAQIATEPIPEGAVTSTLPTPNAEVPEPKPVSRSSSFVQNGRKRFELPDKEIQTEHSEKQTSAVEDESAELTTGDIKHASLTPKTGPNGTDKKDSRLKKPVLSKAMPKAKEPLKKETPKAKNTPRQSIGSSASHFTAPTQASSAHKQKTSVDESSNTASPKPRHIRVPTKPVTLPSHLTAPTTSSAAKRESLPGTTKLTSTTSASKFKELPSHLLAPTASSAAKHASESSQPPKPEPSGTKRTRQSLAPASTIPKARTTASRQSLDARKLTAAAPEARKTTRPTEGFLERMTRPTTSSSSKTNDKTEAKTPPRQIPMLKSRASSVRTNNEPEKKSRSVSGEIEPDSATSQPDDEEFELISSKDAEPESEPESEPVTKNERAQRSTSTPEPKAGPSTEQASESAPEPEAESKVEAEAETKPKAEGEPAVKSESKTESNDTAADDSKVELKVEPENEAKKEVEQTPELKAEIKTTAKEESPVGTKHEEYEEEDEEEGGKNEPEVGTKPEGSTDATPEVENKGSESEPEPEPKPENRTEPGSEAQAVVELKTPKTEPVEPEATTEPLQLTEEQPTKSSQDEEPPVGVLPLTETKHDKPVTLAEAEVKASTSDEEEKAEEGEKEKKEEPEPVKEKEKETSEHVEEEEGEAPAATATTDATANDDVD